MAIEEIVSMVAAKSCLSKEEVLLKIKNKQQELSGLVSDEGAAYIIANELGVRARSRVVESAIPIANVQEGMKSVTVNGRVIRITGPRSFKTKNGRKGKVANLRITDKSAAMNVALWNMTDIEKIEKNELKTGDVVQVKNGYVKPGFRGGLELNLGNRGILVTNPEDVDESDFPKTAAIRTSSRVKIANLQEGDTYKEIRAAVVDFFGNSFCYSMCPNCNKRINGSCGKCGNVKPEKLLVLNLMVDDGSGAIRASLFRDAVEKFTGMKTENIEKNPEKVKEKLKTVLGSEFLFNGRIKRNGFSGELEFNAYSASQVKPDEEAKKILSNAS